MMRRGALARTVRGGVAGLLSLAVLVAPFPAGAVDFTRADAGERAFELRVGEASHAPIRWDGARLDHADLYAAIPDEIVDSGDVVSGPIAAVSTEAEADERLTTLEQLLAMPRPARDPIALANRVNGTAIPWAATEPFTGPLTTGHQATFYVLDQTDNSYKERQATLRLVSASAYWYVQDGQSVGESELAAAARQFDEVTVPTVRRAFGSEWSPGIDSDGRVTIFLGQAPGVGAYFSSWDEYPRSVYRFSNEREMIHVNVGSVRPGSGGFDGTIAHEFQHMVHWHLNPQSDTWLDEGMAELAASVAFPGRPPGTGGFQRQPNVQLTAWSQSAGTSLHYQAAYLFSRYFAQRFGQDAVARLLSEPGRPPDTITAFLSRNGLGLTFEDVFEDWIVANLLDDPAVEDGRYAHDGLEHRATPSVTLRPNGQVAPGAVRQFGAEYIELAGDGSDAELVFTGEPTVRLVGADATSGRGLWWTNRADGMDTTLTRSFDLSSVTSATLRFNLWYDTERDFDFLYVLVSTDGGTRWQALHGQAADDENPTGNAIGPGYSGRSGVAGGQNGEPSWITEQIDLTPYVGGEVMVRFEYVTDQGFNARGALLDDIEIPEIGFRDDAEADAGWTAEGFLRSGNVIPQTWSLQLVEFQRGGQTTVRPLRVDASGQITERIPALGGATERAVLVVSGLAPRTLEAASYQVTLQPSR